LSPGPAETELLLQFVAEQAPVLLLRFDRAGSLLWANSYAQAALGVAPGQQVAGEVFICFGRPFAWDAMVPSDRWSLASLNSADGGPRSYLVKRHELPEGVLVLGYPDVEELEQLRMQLVQLSNEVGNLNREIQQRNAELRRLNELKNQFLGMAAHDLRKPTGAVMAYSEFLVDEAADALSEEHRGFLQVIQRASGTMRRLIDDFLDVAVIEGGRIELELRPTDLGSVIHAALALIEPAAARHQVSVLVELPDDLPQLPLDAPKMEQVVLNLVGNAVEHCGPGTRVSVRARAGAEIMTLEVADDGPGIPAQRLEQLFVLTGTHGARKASGERSLGLGLVIVSKLVQAHGGSVRVHSDPSQGTTFLIELPLTATQPR